MPFINPIWHKPPPSCSHCKTTALASSDSMWISTGTVNRSPRIPTTCLGVMPSLMRRKLANVTGDAAAGTGRLTVRVCLPRLLGIFITKAISPDAASNEQHTITQPIALLGGSRRRIGLTENSLIPRLCRTSVRKASHRREL